MANKRILIVEDELLIAEGIRRTLDHMEYEVTDVVANGEDAFNAFSSCCPDLVLMDIELAGNIDGIRATETIRAKYDVPVVYITAHADHNTVERAGSTMPFGYLIKPFNDQQLDVTIKTALTKSKVDREIKRMKTFLETVLNSIHYAVIVIDRDMRIVMNNNRAIKHMMPLNWSRHSLCYNAIFNREAPCEACVTQEVFRTGRSVTFENDGRGDGNIWEIEACPIVDETGDTIMAVEICRDITERKFCEMDREALIRALSDEVDLSKNSAGFFRSE